MRLWIFVIFAPRGQKEKQKLKVKNTKNKFLITFKFSSREKKLEKILTGRKTCPQFFISVKWFVSDSFKSIFLEIYGQDAGCRLVYVFCEFAFVWVESGNDSKGFNKTVTRTLTQTYIYKNVHLHKCTKISIGKRSYSF